MNHTAALTFFLQLLSDLRSEFELSLRLVLQQESKVGFMIVLFYPSPILISQTQRLIELHLTLTHSRTQQI
jgi:hypothetical protein